MSAGRTDSFAVEAYETSAKLAILANNMPQISTILPHLVRVLHWPIANERGSKPDLAEDLANISIALRTPVSAGTRARFASYLLLHTLCQLQDPPAFQAHLRDLICFDKGKGANGIPATDPAIEVVLTMFRIWSSGDYASLAKILHYPRKYDKFAWLIVRSSLTTFRQRIWAVLRSSYQFADDISWLLKMLSFSSEVELRAFLVQQNWQTHIDDNRSRVLLKQAAK